MVPICSRATKGPFIKINVTQETKFISKGEGDPDYDVILFENLNG